MDETADQQTGPTLADLVAALPGLSILAAALELTGQDALLGDEGADLTLLAPTNNAFVSLASDIAPAPAESVALSLSNDDVTIAAGNAGTPRGDVREFSLTLELATALAPGAILTDPNLGPVNYQVRGTLDAGNPSEFGSFNLLAGAINPDGAPLSEAQFYGNGGALRFEIDGDADLSDGLQASELVPLGGLDLPAPVDTDGAVFLLDAREDGTGRYHPPLLILRADGTGQVLNSNNTGVNGQTGRDIVAEDGLDYGLEYVTEFTFDPAALTLVAPPIPAAPPLDTSDDAAILAALVEALDELDPDRTGTEILADVLAYHVAPSALTASEIAGSDAIPTLAVPDAIRPAAGRLIDFEPDRLDAEIVGADTFASNGVLQVIDGVLLPLDIPGNDLPSLADLADAEPGFAVLAAALERTGLDVVLRNADTEFTLFAPTDAAFADLSAGFEPGVGDTPEAIVDALVAGLAGTVSGAAPGSDLGTGLLAELLLYHAVPEAVPAAFLGTTGALATARDLTPVLLSESAGLFDNDPDRENARLVEGGTDLVASNGLFHTVDAVLLPVDLADPAPAATLVDLLGPEAAGFDEVGDDFDILRALVGEAGLTAALDDSDERFTLFAPTDDAFAAFAAELAGPLGPPPDTEGGIFDLLLAELGALTGGMPTELLSSLLLYHVQDGAETRAALSAGPALESLVGASPQATAFGLVDVDRGFANPGFVDALSDVTASNGLLHAIDRVALPINLPDETDLIGGPEDDIFEAGPGILVVSGGPGTDTARFPERLEDAAFDFLDGGFAASLSGPDARQVDLFGIDRIEFADASVEVSESVAAAQVFRLFGVGLGREGDLAGVSFWTAEAETRGIGFVADAILVSDEFAGRFGGAVPFEEDIVEAFYGNFLGREPDAPGLAFWTEQVTTGSLDSSELLLAFSESAEFRSATENATDDGVLLLL